MKKKIHPERQKAFKDVLRQIERWRDYYKSLREIDEKSHNDVEYQRACDLRIVAAFDIWTTVKNMK